MNAIDDCKFELVTLNEFRRMVHQDGIGLDYRDYFGLSLLDRAVITDRLDLVKYLLDEGVDPNEHVDLDDTSLIYAVSSPEPNACSIAAMLLERGADVHAVGTFGPAIFLACGFGNLEMVRLLLDHGADMEQAGEDDVTPLMRAAVSMHPAVVRFLLERGANVRAKGTVMGLTVLEYAITASSRARAQPTGQPSITEKPATPRPPRTSGGRKTRSNQDPELVARKDEVLNLLEEYEAKRQSRDIRKKRS